MHACSYLKRSCCLSKHLTFSWRNAGWSLGVGWRTALTSSSPEDRVDLNWRHRLGFGSQTQTDSSPVLPVCMFLGVSLTWGKWLDSWFCMFLQCIRQCLMEWAVYSVPMPSKTWEMKLSVGLGMVWILSTSIPILLFDSDSAYRFPVSIPMWLDNDIKHLSRVSF